MALVEAEAREGGDLAEQLLGLLGVRPLRSMQPSTNRAWSFSISRVERQVPMARRKPSESAALKPATSMAIFITCSW